MLSNIESKGIFSKKTMALIRQIKGFRNILVHKYGDTNNKKAYQDSRQGLEDFEVIIKEIEDFLARHKKELGNRKKKK